MRDFCLPHVILPHVAQCVILPLFSYHLRPYNIQFKIESNLLFPSPKDTITKRYCNLYSAHLISFPPQLHKFLCQNISSHGAHDHLTTVIKNFIHCTRLILQVTHVTYHESHTSYYVCYRIPYECINHVSIIYYSLWMDLRYFTPITKWLTIKNVQFVVKG
jgi:hypothetical protein